MKLSIECGCCGKPVEADVQNITELLMECAQNKSIFTGFFCADCEVYLDDDT